MHLRLLSIPIPSLSMRILFDHGTPAPLIPFLPKHTVTKARDAGWDRLTNRLTNGELLNAAEAAGFDLLVTTNKKHALSAELVCSCHLDCRSRKLTMADRRELC